MILATDVYIPILKSVVKKVNNRSSQIISGVLETLTEDYNEQTLQYFLGV